MIRNVCASRLRLWRFRETWVRNEANVFLFHNGPFFLEFGKLGDCFVVGVLGGGHIAVHSGQFLGFFEECFRDGNVRVFGAFGELGEEGRFDSLGAHEPPGVGGDLIDQNALGFIGGLMRFVHALAEFFIGRCVFAGDDDLCPGESVPDAVAACGVLALLGLGSRAVPGVIEVAILCG